MDFNLINLLSRLPSHNLAVSLKEVHRFNRIKRDNQSQCFIAHLNRIIDYNGISHYEVEWLAFEKCKNRCKKCSRNAKSVGRNPSPTRRQAIGNKNCKASRAFYILIFYFISLLELRVNNIYKTIQFSSQDNNNYGTIKGIQASRWRYPYCFCRLELKRGEEKQECHANGKIFHQSH